MGFDDAAALDEDAAGPVDYSGPRISDQAIS
jgi:hypothetical protein